MMKSERFATCDADVIAFHPGPARTDVIPNPPLAVPEARLAEKEQALLEACIERFADRDGALADLARAIIVLRAEVGPSAANPIEAD